MTEQQVTCHADDFDRLFREMAQIRDAVICIAAQVQVAQAQQPFESANVTPARLVNRREAARILGRSPKTLSEWKLKCWGPSPIVSGGRIFYSYDECMMMACGELPIIRESSD